MGFAPFEVREIIQELTSRGERIDVNQIIDRLTARGSSPPGAAAGQYGQQVTRQGQEVVRGPAWEVCLHDAAE